MWRCQTFPRRDRNSPTLGLNYSHLGNNCRYSIRHLYDSHKNGGKPRLYNSGECFTFVPKFIAKKTENANASKILSAETKNKSRFIL